MAKGSRSSRNSSLGTSSAQSCALADCCGKDGASSQETNDSNYVMVFVTSPSPSTMGGIRFNLKPGSMELSRKTIRRSKRAG